MADESTPSVESSAMALLESDANQVPTPVFDIELEPSPETLESEQGPDPSLEPSPTQKPTSNDSLANLLSTQALLLAPKLPNPSFGPTQLSPTVLEFPSRLVPTGLIIVLGLIKSKCKLCRVNQVLSPNQKKVQKSKP